MLVIQSMLVQAIWNSKNRGNKELKKGADICFDWCSRVSLSGWKEWERERETVPSCNSVSTFCPLLWWILREFWVFCSSLPTQGNWERATPSDWGGIRLGLSFILRRAPCSTYFSLFLRGLLRRHARQQGGVPCLFGCGMGHTGALWFKCSKDCKSFWYFSGIYLSVGGHILAWHKVIRSFQNFREEKQILFFCCHPDPKKIEEIIFSLFKYL